jgi:hypothetical protein
MYGETGDDCAMSVQALDNGTSGYIVAGYSNSTDITDVLNNGGYDYYIIKMDTNGSLETEGTWQNMYGGSNYDEAFSIQQITGGYVVAGLSWSTIEDVDPNDSDFYIIKLGTDGGDPVWQKMYGG